MFEFPKMECKGCGRCCGLIPCSEKEAVVIKAFMIEHKIEPIFHKDGLSCPLLGEDSRCMIYEVRPAICRAFGHSVKMVCPNGCNVDVDDSLVRVFVRNRSSGQIVFLPEYLKGE